MANGRGKDSNRSGWVYFIRCPSNGFIKIGFTADNLRKRLMKHRASSPVELVPLGMVPGTVRDERVLHAQFKGDWSHGEWFRPSEALSDYIEGETEPCPNSDACFTRPAVGKARKQTVEEWAKVTTLRHDGHVLPVAEWARIYGVAILAVRMAYLKNGAKDDGENLWMNRLGWRKDYFRKAREWREMVRPRNRIR